MVVTRGHAELEADEVDEEEGEQYDHVLGEVDLRISSK